MMSSLALDAQALAGPLAARDSAGRAPREVFFVGCGASMADLYPSRFFLSTESRSLRADICTANEFVHAVPRALGERSILVACSHGGGTREAVEAARIARSRGAFCVTLTHNESADISAHAHHNVVYRWGNDAAVADNPMAIVLGLTLEILQQAEGYDPYDDFRNGIGRIDGVVAAARERNRERAAAFAERCRDESLYYVLSSGASYAHAYAFAICSLMEMQWLHASALHSGEFFHGPFEITDGNTPFIVLVNEGRTRPLDERVTTFLERYAGTVEIVDARELGLGELPPTVVDYFNPVLFYSVLSDYRAALAEVRGHPLDRRRYMGKVDY